ncbi:hypothetical protein GCM10009651_03200 [Microbacterium natoriense]
MVREMNAATGLVPGAHRAIRVLDADEGPFRGTLVADGERVAVCADAAAFSGWTGWMLAGSDHVAGPLDLVRRADGHDVLLPWCTERISAFLGRRAAAGSTLAPGEVSTLVASLLRGVAECGERIAEGSGTWWITDGGRPMFVIGEGEDVRIATARIVELVQRECTDRALGRLLSSVQGGLTEGSSRPRMLPQHLTRWEAELFELAAPRALDREVLAPERVRDIEMHRDEDPRAQVWSRRELRRASDEGDASRGVGRAVRSALVGWGRAASGTMADLLLRLRPDSGRGVARETGAGLRSRIGRGRRDDGQSDKRREGDGGRVPRPQRRRAQMIAGVAAVAVLAVGLLWPADGAETVGAVTPETRVSTPPESPAATPDALPHSAPESPGPEEDPLASGPVLLDTISQCLAESDAACTEAVAEGSAGVVDALAVALRGEERPELALVDEYGDVAVVRMSAVAREDGGSPSEGERMLVLVRLNEHWLVRDVYDVADQPG